MDIKHKLAITILFWICRFLLSDNPDAQKELKTIATSFSVDIHGIREAK